MKVPEQEEAGLTAGLAEIRTVSSAARSLTSGRRLARNTLWNLCGNLVPLPIAFFCIPPLLKALGTTRFGILSLIWALIGYAAVFDFGLGRALTQLVATKLGDNGQKDVPALVWTSQLMMLVLGLSGTALLFALSGWLVRDVLHVPVSLQRETLWSLYFLALSVPVVISTAGLRGLLEAYQQFAVVGSLRLPNALLTFGAPLLALPFSHTLAPVVTILAVGRFIMWLAHLFYSRKVVPEVLGGVAWRRQAIRPLLEFGGWMTISNIVSPLMVTLDRFVIAALVSVAAVAYYAIPFDVITKLWLVPAALLGVMFPAFTMTLVHDRARTVLLYERSLKLLLLCLFPVIVSVIVFANDGLRLWVGPDFAAHSTRVLEWLAAGVFVNCLAQVPFGLIQGAGRPDLTAKMHLLELPGYLLGLYYLSRRYGVDGAAIAWTARVLVDGLALFLLSKRFLPPGRRQVSRITLVLTASFIVFASGSQLEGLIFKAVFVLLTLAAFVPMMWFLVLSPEERTLAQKWL